MDKARKELEDSFNTEIRFYVEKIRMWKENKAKKESYFFAEAIDRILNVCEEPEVISISQCNATLTFKNVEDARKFVGKVMDKFNLNKFNKAFHTWGAEVRWYYNELLSVEGKNCELRVYPCEPSTDCVPIQVQYEVKREKWICEATGKELR